ncbi:hypothetical protein GA0115251_11844 [Streptomyces sp. TverLS-915]|nr:hypothetical protein GA0115251_11844 [Streptomyces sp. TverLS-915]
MRRVRPTGADPCGACLRPEADPYERPAPYRTRLTPASYQASWAISSATTAEASAAGSTSA